MLAPCCGQLDHNHVRNGGGINLWGCNGSPSQQWVVSGNSIMIASNPNFCLNVSRGATRTQ